ncbi:MAG: mechanosensitive ion channel family protein [Cyanothece sp. SIO1E1]|nr:mechanosensitive ion channel family protein [Cyanothece sp. SIO1E1]
MKRYLQLLVVLALSALLIVTSSTHVFAQDTATSSDGVEAATVILNGKTLFEIQAGFDSKSAGQRAREITNKVEGFAKDPSLPVDSLQIGDQDGVMVIFSGQTVLARITKADARAVNSTPQALAQRYVRSLKNSISQYREAFDLTGSTVKFGLWDRIKRLFQQLYVLPRQGENLGVGRAILYTIIATINLIILLFILNVIFPFVYTRLLRRSRRNRQIGGLRIQNFELLSGGQITNILLNVAKNVRFVLTGGLIVIYVFSVLSFFPSTNQIGKAFFDYSADALNDFWQAFLAYIPSLFYVALIAFITYYTLRFIEPIFDGLEKGTIAISGFYPDWARPTYRLIEVAIFALAAIVIVPYLPGFGSDAFQGVSLFVGVLLSLGSTAALSNAIAGIILIYTRAFQVGDRVKVSDTLGNVEEKLLLVTRIRTFENVIITIPNSALLSGNVINYSASIRDTNTPVMLSTTVTLGYDVPWQTVYETLTEAARSTIHVLQEPAPFVLQTGLGDFSVSYEVKAYTNKPTVMEAIYSELHQHIQDKCNEAEIEILSPTYSAVRDGNQSTIPENYLPQDYSPAGFQLHPLGNLFQIDLKMGSGNNHKGKNPSTKQS